MNFKIIIFSIVISGLMLQNTLGQGIFDGFSKGKGNLDFAFSYSREEGNKYFTPARDIPISRSITAIGLYTAYGVTNKLDIIVTAPYLMKDNEKKWQDGGAFVKFKPYSLSLNSGRIDFFIGTGYSFPMSDYKTNGGNAIGQQTQALVSRGIIQFTAKKNYFFSVQGGYNANSTPTPYAIGFSAKGGFYTKKSYADVWVDYQKSGGITYYRGRGEFAPSTFRELGVDFLRFGGTYCYNLNSQFTGFIGTGITTSGRNTFNSIRYSIGMVVKFSTNN